MAGRLKDQRWTRIFMDGSEDARVIVPHRPVMLHRRSFAGIRGPDVRLLAGKVPRENVEPGIRRFVDATSGTNLKHSAM